MGIVREVINSRPFDGADRTIHRDEAKLFEAVPAPAMRFLGTELPPLDVFTVPVVYEPVPFAPPRGVFEGSVMRLEWQPLNGRQPVSRRNADVDEIGFQICGERALITECGTVQFKVGQFSRIPVGVAHDNYCEDDIHLIFYVHGPATPGIEPVGHAEHKVPPFAGWEAKPTIDAMTNAMGGPGGAISYSMADEQLIVDAARDCEDPLEILEPKGSPGETEWVYRAPKVWIGHTCLEKTGERLYHRSIGADEIQFQAEGSRTIVSQRGVVTLSPGDFVTIPRGCSYANVAEGASKHLSVLVTEATPPVETPSRQADPDVLGWLTTHVARLEPAA